MSSVIYFIRRESDGLVKIGTTIDIKSRFSALRAKHGDLTLLGTISGGKTREKMIHWCFQSERVRGEWFESNDEIEQVISEYVSLPPGWIPPPLKSKSSKPRKKLNSGIENRLKIVLAEKGMSIAQLSKNIGVTYSMVYDFANMQRRSFKFSLLDAICEELDVTVKDILVLKK